MGTAEKCSKENGRGGRNKAAATAVFDAFCSHGSGYGPGNDGNGIGRRTLGRKFGGWMGEGRRIQDKVTVRRRVEDGSGIGSRNLEPADQDSSVG